MNGWRVWADWGTTRLRLWRVIDGVPVEHGEGPGIGALTVPAADTLRVAIAPWCADHGQPTCITLCGMAGARNGLHEAGYVECPAGITQWRAAAAVLMLDGVPVRIGAGCASARDVMRGEETQIFGALARDPALARGHRVIVLPGTHSKWVWLEDGRIAALRTFMTGELYALLQGSSLFATGRADTDPGDGFATGLALAREGAGALGELFQPRIVQLRQGRTAGFARALLSGLLIGGEAAELRAAGALPGAVTLIGAPALATNYTAALAAFGVTTTALPGDDCVLAGLEILDADD